MDAPLSPQISLEDPAFNVSFLATLFTDAPGAAVSPVNGAASATASDHAVPSDDSSNVSCLAALSTDVSGVAVSPVKGAASAAASDHAVPADDSFNVSCLAALSTDAVGKTVPPFAGAAAGTAADAALADDVGASATPFDDTVGEDTGACHGFSRRCCSSKCHCRRRRLLRSLRQGEHRHLHISTSVLPVTSDRRDSP